MRRIDNHTILTRFISKEIAEVYKKYNKIGDDEVGLVGAFIDKIEGNGVDFRLYQDYDNTRSLAETLGNEDNINLIKLYIFLTIDLDLKIGLEDARGHYENLRVKGYVQVDKYLFYYDYGEDELETLAEESLVDDLEDMEKVMKMFDEEEIANMWIFQTSKKEAIEQYIVDMGWYEPLGIEDQGKAYMDKHNSEVRYALNEGSDIFE